MTTRRAITAHTRRRPQAASHPRSPGGGCHADAWSPVRRPRASGGVRQRHGPASRGHRQSERLALLTSTRPAAFGRPLYLRELFCPGMAAGTKAQLNPSGGTEPDIAAGVNGSRASRSSRSSVIEWHVRTQKFLTRFINHRSFGAGSASTQRRRYVSMFITREYVPRGPQLGPRTPTEGNSRKTPHPGSRHNCGAPRSGRTPDQGCTR